MLARTSTFVLEDSDYNTAPAIPYTGEQPNRARIAAAPTQYCIAQSDVDTFCFTFDTKFEHLLYSMRKHNPDYDEDEVYQPWYLLNSVNARRTQSSLFIGTLDVKLRHHQIDPMEFYFTDMYAVQIYRRGDNFKVFVSKSSH